MGGLCLGVLDFTLLPLRDQHAPAFPPSLPRSLAPSSTYSIVRLPWKLSSTRKQAPGEGGREGRRVKRREEKQTKGGREKQTKGGREGGREGGLTFVFGQSLIQRLGIVDG